MNELIEIHSLRWATCAGLLVIALITVLYTTPLYDAVGPFSASVIYNLLTVLIAVVDVALAFLLWRAFEAGEVLKKIWGSLTIGLALWAVGEMIWAFYEIFLDRETPYPSVADVAWVVGFIPLWIALFWHYLALGTRPERRQLITGGLLFGALVIVSVIFVIGPIVTAEDSGNWTEQFLNVLYPLGDLAVALGGVLCVMVLAGGELAHPWLVIATGFIVVSIADLLFAYSTWNELYIHNVDNSLTALGAVTDILYLTSYVVIMIGLLMQARIQRLLR